jgi:broad specificity phosphatase PhoE
MGKLILIRHGKTLLNSLDDAERLRGWMDVPLDEQGLNEAVETAAQVARHQIQEIYTSDLYRAQQTAAAVVQATGAPLLHTYDLRPWNVGTLAGQRVKDILPILQELKINPDLPAPGGESFAQFYKRYSAELWNLIEVAERSPNCIVAVTHVRNLLAAPTVLRDGDKTKIPVKGGPKTGSLVWIERRYGKLRVRVDSATGLPPARIENQLPRSPIFTQPLNG